MFLALRDGVPVAGALNIIGEDVLYGRYWGCSADLPFLHFELSYYQRHRVGDRHTAFRRSRLGRRASTNWRAAMNRSSPARSISFADPGFRSAIDDFLVRERHAITAELAWCRAALPYRSA